MLWIVHSNGPISLYFQDLDAVAVAVEPGLPFSLEVGVNYAKQLVMQHRLEFCKKKIINIIRLRSIFNATHVCIL